jgi:hypothetical protein
MALTEVCEAVMRPLNHAHSAAEDCPAASPNSWPARRHGTRSEEDIRRRLLGAVIGVLRPACCAGPWSD